MFVYVHVSLSMSTFDFINFYYTVEEQGVGAHSLACSTLGVKGHARALGWD